MSSRWSYLVSGVILGLVLAGGVLTAQEQPAPAAATQQQAMTVFISVHSGKDTAEKVNQAFATYTPQGWQFADMEVNVENSDQKGVWLTFVK